MRGCIRMQPGTKSWHRWRKRRLRVCPNWFTTHFSAVIKGPMLRIIRELRNNHMKSSLHYQRITFVLFVAVSALAQQPAPPSIPSTGFAGLDQYRASRIAVFTDDYGQLVRYRAANAALKPPAPGENRGVFFGDSITDIWHLDEYFPSKPYVNRGIGGQTTSQMLVRFRQDVIDLQPKVVVILAGTNDIAGNTGPMRLEDIEANYSSFVELARAHNIKVIYSSVLPVHNYTERADRKS